ncbi:uncharacterized protein LOC110183762 [Drosophila serrata]|uniref:uncharacterized protein LOC110183762 n=1 Tax=Drosophila serrata TaxID=7274 RepID=UPI000A1CFE28|nr:uncharacterized protein LOC110183762 [Drosophila serrata]
MDSLNDLDDWDDLDDFVLNYLRIHCRKSKARRKAKRLRLAVVSRIPPSAEQIRLREVEQFRRRRKVMAKQFDMNLQADMMYEFEETMKEDFRRREKERHDSPMASSATTPQNSPTWTSSQGEMDQDDSNEYETINHTYNKANNFY